MQSPFLQQLRSRFGKVGFRLLLVLVPLFLLRACVMTYVPPGMVGVRQVSYGPRQGAAEGAQRLHYVSEARLREELEAVSAPPVSLPRQPESQPGSAPPPEAARRLDRS